MEYSKLIFILVSTIGFLIVPSLVSDARRYYLCLASFLNAFTSGWVFFYFTGLMLADLPILCLFFLGIFTGKKFNWKAFPIGLPVIGMIVWGVVTSFSASEPGWAIAEISKYLRVYLLILVIIQNVQNISDLRLVVFSILSGMLIESVLGIYQSHFGALGIWFLGERPAWRVGWRVSGTFYVASFYANYLALSIVMAYRMFVYYRPPNIRQTIFFGAAFLLGVVALLKTWGRSPWIGSAVALVLTSFISFFNYKYKSYSKWVIPILYAFVLFFTLLYHQKILDQFGETRRLAYESRFVQWRVAKRMIAARPWTGFGLGNYQLHAKNYLTPEEKRNNQAMVYSWMVHNSYLLYAAEVGLPGAAILVLWFLSIIWMCALILLAKISHSFIVNTTMGILGGIIAFLIVLGYSPDIHEYSLLYQLGLFSGILVAEWKILKRVEWQKICSQKNGMVRTD
jgi:O-antigen ligase